MKTIVSLVSWLPVCYIVIFGLCACAPKVSGNSLSLAKPTKIVEPPECLNNLTFRLRANPSNIVYGQSSVVSWSVDLPSECARMSVRFNGRAVAQSGSQTVRPSYSKKYTVTVNLFRGGFRVEKTRSTNVTVDYPPHVVIDQITIDPVAVLLGSLSSSINETVELCNVDLDLTRSSSIIIGDNKSLIASPGCERGPLRDGPRIFVTDKRGSEPLFMIHGDHVRISGFQLEGPTSYIESDDDNKEKGIQIWPSGGASPVQSVEISNMEIFHWSGAGVYVRDNQDPNVRGRLFNTNVDAVRIKNNYIHHNRHYGGEGYGVDVDDGAYALIEQNVFEANRHAIAAGSVATGRADYTGYTARDNLILPGGGEHSKFWGTHTHQIDMHGDQNEWPGKHNWLCGTAGETIIIERNTILYNDDEAIKIRGNPTDKAVVDSNVFVHVNRNDAISQNGECGWFSGDNITNPIDVRPNNVFGANPMAELGSCDFDGDGQLDQFMATGVTWWAKSSETNQWRYLNTMPELLSQLRLGRFDGDPFCDVAPRTGNPIILPEKYSKSGTGPWVPFLELLNTP